METIKKVTQEVYEKMPKQFSAPLLCRKVRVKLNRPTMDGTILRRLRELRADGITPYKIFDNQKSIYEKL